MAKKLSNQTLDDLSLKTAKPKDKHYTLRDCCGLFLLEHPNGSKYFQLSTTLRGKPKLLQLGAYPDLILSQERVEAIAKRRMIDDHKDPIIEAKLEKANAAKSAEVTFRQVAELWLDL